MASFQSSLKLLRLLQRRERNRQKERANWEKGTWLQDAAGAQPQTSFSQRWHRSRIYVFRLAAASVLLEQSLAVPFKLTRTHPFQNHKPLGRVKRAKTRFDCSRGGWGTHKSMPNNMGEEVSLTEVK